jgi:hypothetical protein
VVHAQLENAPTRRTAPVPGHSSKSKGSGDTMTNTQKQSGEALAEIIRQVDVYCSAYKAMYEQPVGDDGVLSQGVTDLLRGVDCLLNGELGRQDGGHLSAQLYELATRNGLTDENGEF